MGSILAFLGGSAFRAIWGELSSWITAKQEHAHELERMRLQGDLEEAQHGRNLESIKVQAELGVQTIRVHSEADIDKIDAQGWASAVSESMKPSGIKVVDGWNQSIRPLAASIAIFLWVVALNAQGFQMSDWDRELVGVILGFFFASRVLSKAGK